MPRHKPKFWQTSQFKELQKKWEERLKESGFKDHEGNGRLYQNASNCYRTKEWDVIENKQRYFELLGQRYHEEIFSDPVEKYVMSRRAEGVKIKEISQELKRARKKNSTDTIRKIIRYYEIKWGIKKKTTP